MEYMELLGRRQQAKGERDLRGGSAAIIKHYHIPGTNDVYFGATEYIDRPTRVDYHDGGWLSFAPRRCSDSACPWSAYDDVASGDDSGDAAHDASVHRGGGVVSGGVRVGVGSGGSGGDGVGGVSGAGVSPHHPQWTHDCRLDGDK